MANDENPMETQALWRPPSMAQHEETEDPGEDPFATESLSEDAIEQLMAQARARRRTQDERDTRRAAQHPACASPLPPREGAPSPRVSTPLEGPRARAEPKSRALRRNFVLGSAALLALVFVCILLSRLL